MKILKIDDINERLRGDMAAGIHAADAAFEAELVQVAQRIRDGVGKCPIVLLSGPSGSGKTTSAQKIERILDGWGYETHTLSMDNYFKTLNENEKRLMAEGAIDLESPDRVDEVLLSSQLEDMIRCRSVELPRYDFKESRQEASGEVLCRKPREIVIVEGIHALNPAVVRVAEDETVKIYVSVRTRVAAGDHILHPSKIRLLRRMLRDRNGRGRTPEETIRLFDSVEEGARRYILPFKHRADFDIDTFVEYELGVYRRFFMENLRHIHERDDIVEICAVMERALPVAVEQVPEDALIREFIGRGCFRG